MKKYLETGCIVGTHGVHGEVRVQPWADSGEFLLRFKRMYFSAEGGSPVTVKNARVHKNIVIMKLADVDTVEQADVLRGKVLYIDRADAKLPAGRYFVQDIIGAKIIDAETGEEYGTVEDVTTTIANDVYHMRGADGKVHFIPAVDSVLAGTDLDAGTIAIHPMKGMFDDED